MKTPTPLVLEGHGVRLEPMTPEHESAIAEAASDGRLWELWYTAVPEPEKVGKYIADALAGHAAGHMLPWVVRDLSNDQIVGSTRYHDIVPNVERVEIGYTWYASRMQRTHVNTACKLLLLGHAFDTLGCKVVGLRTDNFNFRSQRAIEALGAKKDGVLRHHQARRDGSVRDSVMYSILQAEWFDVKRHLELRIAREAEAPPDSIHTTPPAMKAFQPYLNFDGTTRDAMTFYHKCLGGTLDIQSFAEAQVPAPPGSEQRTIHAKLEYGSAVLMASDTMQGAPFTQGNNVWVNVDCDSIEEIERIFPAMAEGGKVVMPLADQFWGARFGMLVDRFGVNWMFNCEKK